MLQTALTASGHLCILVVAAYVLSRNGFFPENSAPAKLTGPKFAAVVIIFTFVALYGTVMGAEVQTKTLGVVLAVLLFGFYPGAAVTFLAAAITVWQGETTMYADLAAIAAALLLSLAAGRKYPEYDGVLYGITAGAIEIIRTLLILLLVAPVSAAKELIYQTSFSMIVLNGCGVIFFVMIITDMQAKERLTQKEAYTQSELQIARKIQMSLLDTNFAVDARADINCFLQPALEVGGDLYCFFKKGAASLLFMLGDVSGKGIPAAITMSRCVSLFQIYARESASPQEILEKINRELCVNNQAQMFVTAVVGELNLENGLLTFASAGHTVGYLVSAQSDTVCLPKPKGGAMGILPKRTYQNCVLSLLDQQYALFYTDGISEAENARQEQFGSERIMRATTGLAAISARIINGTLYQSVLDFVKGYAQSDDIALLTVGYQKAVEFKIKNNMTEVAALCQSIPDKLAATGMSGHIAYSSTLIIEEIVSNIVKYGYREPQDDEITVAIAGNEIIITDSSAAFDPFTAVSPTIGIKPSLRPVGGMGMILVKKRVKSYNYESRDGRNICRITVKEAEENA